MAIYMKIDNIDGDVTAKGYEKWIQASSFIFGVSRNIQLANPGKSANRESSKPSVSDIAVTKKMDKTSPLIFSESVGTNRNSTISSVQIHICKTGNSQGSVEPAMEYTLSNVLVSSYNITSATGNSPPMETITFNFDKIESKFIPYDEQNKQGSPIPAGYNIATAEKV